MRSPVASSYTTVPTGTLTSSDWPSAPVRWLPSPWRPRSALCSGLKRNWSSVLACSLHTMTTSPHRPPSPPLGPPRGTYFSRRKARQPLPPSPAFTRILTSSINIEMPNMEKPPACSAAGGPFGSKEGYAVALAWMLTNLPIRPRSLNSTTPVTLANRVSSLPQPTLVPGFSLVPRWRTMMLPPGTNWPPKTFTPSRWAFESRPFLELPKPFLCAIRYLRHHLANLHFRVGLAVPDGFLVLFLALELEDQDLGCPVGADDSARHFAAGNQLAAFFKRCLDGKLDFGADVAGQFFDADHITGCYPILLSACLDDRVHANLRLGAGTHGVCRNRWSKEPVYYIGAAGSNVVNWWPLTCCCLRDTSLMSLYRTGYWRVAVAFGLGICFATLQAAPANPELALRVQNETAPAGGWAQIKIFATSPHLVSSGAISMYFDPSVFGGIASVAVFSATGDALGYANVSGQHV